MRKLYLLFALLLSLTGVKVFSQSQSLQTKHKNTRFQSYNTLILLVGDQTVSGGLQSVNGIGWNTFFAGVGLGLDLYRVGTAPLFLDLRKSFGKGKRQFFVYGDIGYQFAWPGIGHSYLGTSEGNDLSGGLYTDIGLGYLVGIGKNDALILSAGYTYKTLTETMVTYPLCPPWGPCELGQVENVYKFNRLSFKIGWRF
jgi:hypothetical protein